MNNINFYDIITLRNQKKESFFMQVEKDIVVARDFIEGNVYEKKS